MRKTSVVLSSVVLSSVALLAGCVSLPEHPGLPPETAVAVASSGAGMGKLISDAEAAHPGQSGFRLVAEGMEAFVIRAHSARQAQRSLDVQTYIWHADTTGMFLARQLLAAADRGVRVRLLVDDLDARAKNAGFAALDAHPNIAVRLFNPFASRSGGMRLASEGLRDFGRINRRMHNKSWIADNRIALVGGRNLGDEYFSASSDVNFVDLDFAMVGPVVRDVSASFDRFWNSSAVWPIELLDKESITDAALVRVRAKLEQEAQAAAGGDYARALQSDDGIRKLVAGEWPMRWASNYRFVSDDPGKVEMEEKDASRAVVAAVIGPIVQGAKQTLRVISPYFVPGDQGTAALTGRAQAGAQVQVLTNSLAANDVASVHGGYSRHRQKLLEGGVQLWELKPAGGTPAKSSMTGSSGASLHTKALTADGRVLFVGSYNLDPRSTWLNSEQGVLVEDAVLAGELEQIFVRQTEGARAWRVSVEEGDLRWSDGQATLDSEPEATGWRKFQAWLSRALHLDAQL